MANFSNNQSLIVFYRYILFWQFGFQMFFWLISVSGLPVTKFALGIFCAWAAHFCHRKTGVKLTTLYRAVMGGYGSWAVLCAVHLYIFVTALLFFYISTLKLIPGNDIGNAFQVVHALGVGLLSLPCLWLLRKAHYAFAGPH